MKKTKEEKPKLTLQIDEETLMVVKNLRDKHHINISGLIRDELHKWNEKLEAK